MSGLLKSLSARQCAYLMLLFEMYPNKIWSAVKPTLQNIMTDAISQLDQFHKWLHSHGNVFYHHLLFQLECEVSALQIKPYLTATTVQYRYVWLSVEDGGFSILSKGEEWYKDAMFCMEMGGKRKPSLDYPDSQPQPQILLSVESRCQCQIAESLHSNTLAKCSCYPFQSCEVHLLPHTQLNLFMQNYPSTHVGDKLIFRLPGYTYHNDKCALYHFWLVQDDVFFYSTSQDLQCAYYDYVCRDLSQN
jgi:hypothetical protein